MSIFDENMLLQQARCRCGVSITSSDHAEGCTYLAEQAKLMQAASKEQLARMNAGAQNAYRPSRFSDESERLEIANAMTRRDERERRAHRRAWLWFALFVVVVAALAAAATTAPLWWHRPVGPCATIGSVQSGYLCAGQR